jgi:5-methyltetrahydrofolate--homocysteine methyltransferase
MAIAHGLTSAITNPVEESIKQAILAADMLAGHDENCLAWIGANRKPAADEGQASERRARPRARVAA